MRLRREKSPGTHAPPSAYELILCQFLTETGANFITIFPKIVAENKSISAFWNRKKKFKTVFIINKKIMTLLQKPLNAESAERAELKMQIQQKITLLDSEQAKNLCGLCA